MKPSHPLFLIATLAGTAYCFLTPPAEGFIQPDLARLIFFHVPCAIISSILMLWSAWCGGVYLKTKKPLWDQRLAASLELALIFSLITITTGMIFSQVQWNAWWHWDDRQTSFLVVVLLSAGAVALRSAYQDEQKRASSSAVYAIGMQAPVIFLTWIYPKLQAVTERSMHPTGTITTNEGLDINHKIGFYGMLLLIGFLTVFIYRMRVKVGMLEWENLNKDETNASDSGDSAPDRVVRPVALSKGD